MRYIGSKEASLPLLVEYIEQKGGPGEARKTFGDLFSGTTVVARAFKRRGWRIICNDLMTYSSIFGHAYITTSDAPRFTRLQTASVINFQPASEDEEVFGNGILAAILAYLNNLPGAPGFVTAHYSPASVSTLGYERRYLSISNAKRIDTIRTTIESWQKAALLTSAEYAILVAALLEAVPYVANISGTYGAFLKEWDARAHKSLTLTRPPLVLTPTPAKPHLVYQSDAARLVREISCDVLYCDPPYNPRQYAPNYHLLETIARGDMPALRGYTGLRDYEEQKSDWCRIDRAAPALADLVEQAQCRYLFLSYSSQGLLTEAQILAILGQRGPVSVYRWPYRPFRSDSNRAGRHYRARSELEELLFCVEMED